MRQFMKQHGGDGHHHTENSAAKPLNTLEESQGSPNVRGMPVHCIPVCGNNPRREPALQLSTSDEDSRADIYRIVGIGLASVRPTLRHATIQQPSALYQ